MLGMRAMWKGSISFGLVNVPVRLYAGAESAGLDLHMLHKTDQSPIRYAKICRKDGKEIAFEDIVKGYEYQEGDYVVLTDEDFEKASPERSKTVEIIQFVDEADIDVRYFEKPYYLEPDRGADKQYALLRDALAKSGRVALAKFVLRNREHLAAIKPVGRMLVLEQMRFPAEVREPSGLNLPEAKAGKQEVELALALIDQLSSGFAPEDYHDTYNERLEEIIEAKAKGRKPKKAAGKEPAPTKVNDLVAALRASLDEHNEAGSRTRR